MYADDYAIWIDPGLGAEVALRSGFEKYWLMDESYPAIWSPSFGVVECELRSVHSKAIKSDLGEAELLQVVLAQFGKDSQDMNPENRIIIPSAGGSQITIGPCSEAFAIHFDALAYDVEIETLDWLHKITLEAGLDWDDQVPKVTGINHRLTLRIEGVVATSEDNAREVLMRVGNGALFELDAIPGLGLSMPVLPRLEERELHPAEVASSATGLRPPELSREYDRDPLYLYWYARSVPETPLVQFLSYYQVLEYYFPTYSRARTLVALREKLSEIYGVARDADVAGIFQALRANRRAVYGGERDQLRHTIEQCVSAEDLQDFLAEHERARFYSDPDSQRIATVRILASPVSTDHRNAAAGLRDSQPHSPHQE